MCPRERLHVLYARGGKKPNEAVQKITCRRGNFYANSLSFCSVVVVCGIGSFLGLHDRLGSDMVAGVGELGRGLL